MINIYHSRRDHQFVVFVGDMNAGQNDRAFTYYQDYPKGQAYTDATVYACRWALELGEEVDCAPLEIDWIVSKYFPLED